MKERYLRGSGKLPMTHDAQEWGAQKMASGTKYAMSGRAEPVHYTHAHQNHPSDVQMVV